MEGINKKGIFLIIFLLAYLNLAHFALANISQGYKSDTDIVVGSIVGLDSNREGYVIKSNTQNIETILGVVGKEGDSLLFFPVQDSTLEVVTSGEAYVFVSDINGEIRVGDRITASPVSGVGMNAIKTTRVVAVALEPFLGTEENVETVSILDSDGTNKEVKIGLINAQVGVNDYIPQRIGKNILFVTLQEAVEVITGRPVSLAKTLIASAVMLSTLILVVMLLAGAIQGSMISLGRNPLAKKTIFLTLFKFTALSIFIFIGGVSMAYFLLVS